MIVYVEAVLLDNFCLDCLLGYLTLSLTGRKLRPIPIVLSAVFGCFVALFSPLLPTLFETPVKVATLLLCSAIFSFRRPIREYLINTFVYAVLSFFLCGLLFFLLGGTGKGVIGISLGGAVAAISVTALLSLYAVRQVRGLVRERKRKEKRVVAEVINLQKSVRLNALFDSGNLLTDASGAGVVVTDGKSIASLGALQQMGEMTVKTASGSRVLPLVKIPEIKIYSRDGENILTNVTAALSDLPDEYSLILPCE